MDLAVVEGSITQKLPRLSPNCGLGASLDSIDGVGEGTLEGIGVGIGVGSGVGTFEGIGVRAFEVLGDRIISGFHEWMEHSVHVGGGVGGGGTISSHDCMTSIGSIKPS